MIPEPHRRIILDLDGVDAHLAPQYTPPEDTPHRGVTPAREVIAARIARRRPSREPAAPVGA